MSVIHELVIPDGRGKSRNEWRERDAERGEGGERVGEWAYRREGVVGVMRGVFGDCPVTFLTHLT